MPARETLAERIHRLRHYIESTRYALTEDDVRWDYETGRNRYSRERTPREENTCAPTTSV